MAEMKQRMDHYIRGASGGQAQGLDEEVRPGSEARKLGQEVDWEELEVLNCWQKSFYAVLANELKTTLALSGSRSGGDMSFL